LHKWTRIGAATLVAFGLALPAAIAAAAPLPVIGPGSRGADVAIVQNLLTANGKPMAATALNGPFTQRLIREFQAQRGLVADGVVGPQTWHALEPELAYGARGSAVVALQQALVGKHGYNLPVTGNFGPQTWDALVGHLVEMAGEGRGWYQTPDAIGGTWGTANTVATLQWVAQLWADRGHGARIGINDISLQHGGWFPPHSTHQQGVDADLRLMRNDGWEAPVQSWRNSTYSRKLTQELVDLLYATGEVQFIFFNDPGVRGVRPWPGHDDHLHVHFRR